MTPRARARLCARTRATQMETSPRPPAAGVKIGSTSGPGLGAPSDPVQAARGVQEKQPCLQAEVAA
jgi:hypothetical protein